MRCVIWIKKVTDRWWSDWSHRKNSGPAKQPPAQSGKITQLRTQNALEVCKTDKSNNKARTLTIKLANNSDISLAFCLSWPLLFSPRWRPTLICRSDAKHSPVAMWRHTGTRNGSINVTGKHVSPAWDTVSNAADKSNISSTTALLPSIACRILQKHDYWRKKLLA